MNLKDRAKIDLQKIVAADFSAQVLLTTPDGSTCAVPALTNDVSEAIDPQTGTLVTMRMVSVVFSMVDLVLAGAPVPRGARGSTFWRVAIDGREYRISQANPDASMSCVSCLCEELS